MVVLKLMARAVIMEVLVLILYFLQLHPQVVVTQVNKAVVVDQVDLVVVEVLTQELVVLGQVIKVMLEVLELQAETHYTAAAEAVVLEKVVTLMELDMEEME